MDKLLRILEFVERLSCRLVTKQESILATLGFTIIDLRKRVGKEPNEG